MQVVILAAGEGLRLRPLTNFLPKALLPIDGIPVINKILETLAACRIKEAVVVIGHLGQKIETFLKKSPHPSVNPVRKFLFYPHPCGRSLLSNGVNISYAYQDKPLGTGHALRKVKSFIKGDFLVVAGDTIFKKEQVSQMLSLFSQGNFDALVGLKRVPKEELLQRGTVKVDRKGFIKEIIEKPDLKERLSNISAAPIFLFTPKIWYYLEKLKPTESGKYELATAIQTLINAGGKVKGYFISGSKDITYPEDILKQNFPYLKKWL